MLKIENLSKINCIHNLFAYPWDASTVSLNNVYFKILITLLYTVSYLLLSMLSIPELKYFK
jgi:hypothetical protein